jgi:hypothetical protein
VQFRKVDESAWRPALPLVRIGGENVYRRAEQNGLEVDFDDFEQLAPPDPGALEVGKPEPKYGPRWLKGQPFYR